MADGPSFQAPYFATPERRLGTIPDLFVAQRGGQATPMTLPGQQLPTWDLGTHIKTGIEAGQLALKNKQVAAEAAAAAEQAKGKQQWAKMYNDYVKLTNASDLPEDEKQARIAWFGAMHGITPDGSSEALRTLIQSFITNPPSTGTLGALKSIMAPPPPSVTPRQAPIIPQTPNNNTPVRPAPATNNPPNNQSNSNNGSDGGNPNTDDKWW